MKLYLDIDGVLLHPKEDKAAEHAAELIEYITSEFDCYWLTTHCKGDSGPHYRVIHSVLTGLLMECWQLTETVEK